MKLFVIASALFVAVASTQLGGLFGGPEQIDGFCPDPQGRFCGLTPPPPPNILPTCPEGQTLDSACVDAARQAFNEELEGVRASLCMVEDAILIAYAEAIIACPDGIGSRQCINAAKCVANQDLEALGGQWESALLVAATNYGMALANCCE